MARASVGGLQRSLTKLHHLLASISKCQELELQADEAHDLAGALHEVQRHFPIPVLGDKWMALAVLAYTAGCIYVPKARAIVDRTSRPGLPAAGPVDVPQPVQQQPAQPGPADWFDPAALAQGGPDGAKLN